MVAEEPEKDLYATLGVERDATPAQIRRAGRKRQKAAHPDAPGGDKDEFQRVQTALAVLGDPERRGRYDETGDTNEKPKFERAAAVQAITSELNAMVSAYVAGGFQPKDDPTRTDAIDRIRERLRGDIATGRASVEIGRRHVEALRKTAGRFKLKNDTGDGDPLADFFADEVAKAEAQIKTIGDSIRVCQIALKMIAGYKFEWDRPDPFGPALGPDDFVLPPGWGRADPGAFRR